MGLQHKEPVPTSFATAPGYLGDPAVVGGLLARFLTDCEADLVTLAGGTLPKAAYEAAQRARIYALAQCFGGDHPEHPGIPGFHGISLPGQLQAALGEFWRANRGAWRDDAVAVLLEWLLLKLVMAWKTAGGDDNVLRGMLRTDVRTVTNLLLGRAPRA